MIRLLARKQSDQTLIDQIKSGGAIGEKAVAELFDRYEVPIVKRFVAEKLSQSIAEQAFLEGLAEFKQQIVDEELRHLGSIEAYMFSLSMTKLKDKGLLQIVENQGEKSEKAATILVERHLPYMERVIRKYLYDQPSEAEEVLADTKTAIWESIQEKKFKGKSAIKTYWARIAANKTKDRFREQNRQDKRFLQLEAFQRHLSDEEQEEGTETQELAREVMTYFDQLDEKCLDILMKRVHDYSWNEIAEESGQTVGGPKNKWARCQEKIEKLIQSQNADLLSRLHYYRKKRRET